MRRPRDRWRWQSEPIFHCALGAGSNFTEFYWVLPYFFCFCLFYFRFLSCTQSIIISINQCYLVLPGFYLVFRQKSQVGIPGMAGILSRIFSLPFPKNRRGRAGLEHPFHRRESRASWRASMLGIPGIFQRRIVLFCFFSLFGAHFRSCSDAPDVYRVFFTEFFFQLFRHLRWNANAGVATPAISRY